MRALLAAALRAAADVDLSIPIGPAYEGLTAQVAARNKEDFRPREHEWRDRGLSFHDLVDNLRRPAPAKLLILVRRERDKVKAAAAARKILGKAADLVDVMTVDEHLAFVVDDLNDMNKAGRERYTVDFGELKGRIAANLRGAVGAVYLVRSAEAP